MVEFAFNPTWFSGAMIVHVQFCIHIEIKSTPTATPVVMKYTDKEDPTVHNLPSPELWVF